MIRTHGRNHQSLSVAEPERSLAAGATVPRAGEFARGSPCLHLADPDGHTIEIWYEP